MNKKTWLILNVVLFVIMLVHSFAMMYYHSLHPEWSAPAYVELLVTWIYYVLPFILLNIICFVLIKINKTRN